MLGAENANPLTDPRRRALVVATDAERAVVLERELADAGLEPHVVADAAAAERRVADGLPDVLVLDRGMPGLALFRLYSALRGRPGGADMPIYFVGEPGTDTSTDHYLPGDSSPGEIVGRVRADLGLAPRHSAGATAPHVVAPELEMDADVGAAQSGLPDGTRTESVVSELDGPSAATEPELALPEARFEHDDAGPATAEAATPVAPLLIESDVHAPVESTSPSVVTPDVSEAERPREPIAASVVTTEPERSAVEITPVPADDPPASRISRLDVILLRLGLVLLLLGGAVLLLRPDSSTQPVVPPNLATATPSATRAPAASPSPAALAPADAAGRR